MSAAQRSHPRPSLAFVGAGRAGSALAMALSSTGYRVAAVHSRTTDHAPALAAACGAAVAASPASAALAAGITFLTVPDSEIVPVSAMIAASGSNLAGRALVHCSASSGPSLLAPARSTGAVLGALHPLQALTGGSSATLLDGTTFALDAPAPLAGELADLVQALGGHVLELPEGSRPLYHAAAVLAGNAPIALLARAVSLLELAGVEPTVAHRALGALLEGAAHNAAADGPAAALTGPVVRGDAATVAAHLDVLAAIPAVRELYRSLAEEMLALVGRSGREDVAGILASVPGRNGASAAGLPAHPSLV